MEQRDNLEIHLSTIADPVAGTKGQHALQELLYTASETGIIEGVSEQDAITIWKLVTLALSFGDDLPQQLRM